MLLGAIADDVTGATDLALMIARQGMATVQTIGIPDAQQDYGGATAVVIALKSRNLPAGEAVRQSLAAGRVLRQAGVAQVIFKYCSTFDSTDQGNIGPVTDALMTQANTGFTIACPAFPTMGRTVYQGHLFVKDSLLSDSPMKDHPLTPMRDANLVRVLQRQTRRRVGLIPLTIVEQGVDALRAAFRDVQQQGIQIAVIDACHDGHLLTLGAACADLPLVTGGSGIGMGLCENFYQSGRLSCGSASSSDSSASLVPRWAAPAGRAVIFAGSCSQATREQIAVAIAAGLPALAVTPQALATGELTAGQIRAFILDQGGAKPALVYSSADPAEVAEAQARLGRERASALIEEAFAQTACALRDDGFRRFLIAGGETSGAIVAALGVTALAIGPEIDPGVPWTRSLNAPEIALALKSGNFGARDFFVKAWDILS